MSKQRFLVPAGITLALTAGLAMAARRSFRTAAVIQRETKGKKDSSEPKEPGSSGAAGAAEMKEKSTQTNWAGGDKWFSSWWLGPSQAVLDDAMVSFPPFSPLLLLIYYSSCE